MVASAPKAALSLRILAITQGQWGERIADYVHQLSPPTWSVQRWAAPRVLPPVIDDPAEFVPQSFAGADLVLALGETPGLYQLIPEVVACSGAKAVIAPIDRNESLPPGLVAQLRGWLADLGVTAVFPKPFCSLTTTTYNQPPILAQYDDPFIAAFAARFGRPRFLISLDTERRVSVVIVERDSACGCAQAVAHGLGGCPVNEAEYQAGMLHHHFPCLAGMNQDEDYHDTLMHVSGHIVREAVKDEIADYLDAPAYFRPMGLADPT